MTLSDSGRGRLVQLKDEAEKLLTTREQIFGILSRHPLPEIVFVVVEHEVEEK